MYTSVVLLGPFPLSPGINPLLGIFSRGLDSLLGIRRQQDGSSVVELDMQLTPQQFDALSGR